MKDWNHTWDVTPREAVRLQEEYRSRVVIAPLPENITLVGGLDVSYKAGRARAAAVLLNYETMEVVEQAVVEIETPFPYIPGLFSFREVPALLAVIEKLERAPDVWMCDAHGTAHPRRFGVACHLGVLLEDMPVIGCAKSILVGKHLPLGEDRGETAILQDRDETIGIAVRSRSGVRPVYVSVGHKADLDSSIALVLKCGRGRRLPEPTRLADKLAGKEIIETDG